MNRDDLVERVREVIGRKSPCVMTREEARSIARAALAIIEPAVREECARVALSYPNAPDAGPHEAHGRDMAAVGIAAAIRAGAKP